MGIFTYPREGIKYRIRNVDYGEYLEQRPSESTIVLRQEKEDPIQHWIFVVENSKKHTYKIYDVEQDSMLYVNSTNKIVFGSPTYSTDRSIWKLITDPLKDQRTYLVDPETYMLYMKDRDHAEMKQETNEYNITMMIKTQNYQWEVIEDSPSELPPGQSQRFRIRTLIGQALQLDGTSGNLTLDTQDRRGNHRTWSITDLGNGKCTIFNQDSKKYLSVRDKGSYNWQPTALADDDITNKENKIWIIQPTSEFTYSLSQECDVWLRGNLTSQTFSLALDNNAAILKPKKAAHNQIWLIEPEDAAVEPSDNADKKDPNEVAPDLSSGEYKLKNTDTVPYYVKVTKKNNAYNVVTCPAQNANKFQVKSQGSGVIIYCRLNGKDIYLAADSGGSIVGQETTYTWKITQADKAKFYYIANDSGRYIGSPGASDSALTLTAKSSSAKQIWQFT